MPELKRKMSVDRLLNPAPPRSPSASFAKEEGASDTEKMKQKSPWASLSDLFYGRNKRKEEEDDDDDEGGASGNGHDA